ncbi:MAG: Glu/Leu/Phe/Val dehydrogenase [Gemmatimonadetes bacterium]|nr:Glu/Leu/Phe/Val dehydrogenase [Gemmatimonadota bacterium]
MRLRDLDTGTEHERVVECIDETSEYHGIIAIHSTVLGVAVGGTRFWPYRVTEDALADALRLSRGMSYKSALAGLNLGGGKAVIIGNDRTVDRDRLFRVHGRFINTLEGRYVTGEDVGTSPADMEIVRSETPYVAGLLDRSVDPSPFTAHGVVRAMEAATAYTCGSNCLAGRRVVVQGCGHVGRYLAKELHRAGAELVVTDVDPGRVAQVVTETGAQTVAPEKVYEVEADIFAPCALGGVLNDETIPRLRVAIVAGAANNQLREGRHGDELEERGILYVPDYVANSGGVINGARELLGWDVDRAARGIEGIYDTTLAMLAMARAQGIAAWRAADRLAEQRLGGRPPAGA